MSLSKSYAEGYVRALFRYVLGRATFSEAEVDHWTKQLLTGRTPIDVFFAFANSTENVRRVENIRIQNTKYPHGHFYSPVVNVKDVEALKKSVFNRGPPMAVDLNTDLQIELALVLSKHFSEMPFAENYDGKHRYYYGNSSYGFGDACVYWAMIRNLRPSRIIEIGSGFTSALALDCIDHYALGTICTFIDPYPALLRKVASPIGERHQIIADKVQNVDPSIVEDLKESDLLFIDSSHVVKTGSDVHFEFTELMPRLRRGVVVHFHDMFYPFEYPKEWVLRDNMSWNELYVMHAFLMYNNAFEIIYFNDFIRKVHPSVLKSLSPAILSRILLNPGGGLWLRRL